MTSTVTEIVLDKTEAHMLLALQRLNKADPARRCTYPIIADEVRKHTKGDFVPALDDLRAGAKNLKENALVVDGGIGFTINRAGIEFCRTCQMF